MTASLFRLQVIYNLACFVDDGCLVVLCGDISLAVLEIACLLEIHRNHQTTRLVDVAVELVIVRHVCQSLGEAAHLAISAGNDQFASLIYISPELFVVHHGGQSLLLVHHAAPLLPNRLGGRLFIESVTVPFQGGLVFHTSVPLVHFDVLAHAGE